MESLVAQTRRWQEGRASRTASIRSIPPFSAAVFRDRTMDEPSGRIQIAMRGVTFLGQFAMGEACRDVAL